MATLTSSIRDRDTPALRIAPETMRAAGGFTVAFLACGCLGCGASDFSPAQASTGPSNAVTEGSHPYWQLLAVVTAPGPTLEGGHVLVAISGGIAAVSYGTAAEVDWYALDPDLTPPAAPTPHQITVSGAVNAIALDGSTLAIGVPWPTGNDKILVFDSVTSVAPPVVLTDPNLPVGASEALGYAIALSGDTLAASAPATSYDDNIGHVLVYHRSNGIWSETPVADIQAPPDLEQTCFTTPADERFGLTVGLVSLGIGDTAHEVLIAGRPLLTQPTPCAQTQTAKFAGNVFVYDHLPSSSWPTSPSSILASPNPAAASCHFGTSIGVGGDSIVIAQDAPQRQLVFAAGHTIPTQQLQTGSTMAFDGTTLAATDGAVISAYRDDADQGAPLGDRFSTFSRLPNPLGFSARWASIAVSGDMIVAGATDGKAYVFLQHATGSAQI
jgi:hypothetical protein